LRARLPVRARAEAMVRAKRVLLVVAAAAVAAVVLVASGLLSQTATQQEQPHSPTWRRRLDGGGATAGVSIAGIIFVIRILIILDHCCNRCGKTQVKCPHCRTKLLVPDSDKSSPNKCPKCKRVFFLNGGKASLTNPNREGLLAAQQQQSMATSFMARQQLQTAAAAAQQQAQRVAGLRLDGVTEAPSLEGIYQLREWDSNSFPVYEYMGAYLYYFAADSSWYISGTVGSGAHKLDIKSEAGPVPIGTQTWDAAVSGSWSKRSYTMTELSEAEVKADMAWVYKLTGEPAPGVDAEGEEEHPVPASEPELQADDLASALKAAQLSKYEDALRELGCTEPDDLRALEEADMMEIGMKRIEIKRLGRLYK
jgi:Zn-finger nucleic acid-binding protein